jgi:hypothetical protein
MFDMMNIFRGKYKVESIIDNAPINTKTHSPLSQYIDYYTSLTDPGYAVLVTGAWGVGKSYQVKQAIPKNRRYFVSLYGVDSVEGIHDAVLAECMPNLKASGALETLGDVGKAMGDKFALAGLAGSIWKTYLRRRLTSDRVIVFDDLERSSLWDSSENELLGAINHYVEHLGFQVIVICYYEKIQKNIKETKEKIFGHTINVKPQTTEAVTKFILDMNNAKRQ